MNFFSRATEETVKPGTLGFPEERAHQEHFLGPVESRKIDVYVVLADAVRLLVHRDALEYAAQEEPGSLKPREEQSRTLLLETLTAGYLNR